MDRYQCYETREIPDQFEKTMPQVFPETAREISHGVKRCTDMY